MLKVNIRSEQVEVKAGTSKKSGNAYHIREQVGLVQLGAQIREVRISLRDDQPPYAPGVYQLDDSSFTTDGFDSLVIRRVVLVPLAAVKAA